MIDDKAQRQINVYAALLRGLRVHVADSDGQNRSYVGDEHGCVSIVAHRKDGGEWWLFHSDRMSAIAYLAEQMTDEQYNQMVQRLERVNSKIEGGNK